MFAPGDAAARVMIGVVAYGDTDRLRACLDSLARHDTEVPFGIVCVVNPVARIDGPIGDLPKGVNVLRPESNLGWAGGLHLARSAIETEFFVWAQDDMVVADGWLDALVRVADSNPRAGAVGSVEVDAVDHRPNGYAGGYAVPPDRVGLWNLTDVLHDGGRYDGGPLGWLTSKGLLTRTRAWDEVGGTDPRLFPLNHVDKDYSIHLRAHGWTLLLAEEAHLVHEKHRSAPGQLRLHLAEWQEPDFDRAWGPVAAELGAADARAVPHPCERVGPLDPASIEVLVGREATRLLVPLAAALVAQFEETRRELTATRETLSWRITAPLRSLRRPGRSH